LTIHTHQFNVQLYLRSTTKWQASVPRFEPGSFMTERERSTNWAINHWPNKGIFKSILFTSLKRKYLNVTLLWLKRRCYNKSTWRGQDRFEPVTSQREKFTESKFEMTIALSTMCRCLVSIYIFETKSLNWSPNYFVKDS
jgi:hypothetical protein